MLPTPRAPDARSTPLPGQADPPDPRDPEPVDPAGPAERLLRQLRSDPTGLSGREAVRRLERFGPNELTRERRRSWPGELRAQLTHPLALLLFAAGLLAFVAGTPVLGWTIIAVVLVNAGFAFWQERQAERAVEALRGYLPDRSGALRDGTVVQVDVSSLVPGDVVVVSEGHRVPADARLLDGEVQVDLSTLTGESAPQVRTSVPAASALSHLEATDLVFSGTTCVAGLGHALVYATGNHTELGRIASLSQRVRREPSPLELQVKKVAWLIAGVALLAGAAFLPLGMLAGLSVKDAFLFSVGLLVANVPEGLLPTITLALAVGVRSLARRGAVVKRLSAVETLGAATVICTDKTGTLTANRMRPVAVWVAASEVALGEAAAPGTPAATFAAAAAAASNAGGDVEDPTEAAVIEAAESLGAALGAVLVARRHVYPFTSAARLMSSVDAAADGGDGLVLHVKGAPEAVLAGSTTWLDPDGRTRPLDAAARDDTEARVHELAGRGLRVLAVADRVLPRPATGDPPWPADRGDAETGLRLLGLVALLDPPRPQVAAAVARCHEAGLRVHVLTGDNGDTAAEIAAQVGIGAGGRQVVTGAGLARLDDAALARLFTGDGEVVCARSSPEDKLRVADVLREAGEVVAMTGDGVNDAPALRRADIGIAMGLSGTDVAREAATTVLSDDNFATIVAAVEEGRRVYDNVRKFIVYIFAHAVPEIVPFLVFALSGGAVPLPLTVLAILAIDLGTETLPALALGREAAEPGLMARRPRPRSEPVVTRALLVRAWGLLGLISAALAMGAFFLTLYLGGWGWGDPTGAGSPLRGVYLQASTATFVAIVACQVGTAFAARTDHASLRSVGVFSNRMLLWGIAFELAFTAGLVYLPAVSELMGMAPPPGRVLMVVATFPVLVWGADELVRWRRRTRSGPAPHQP